VAGEHGRYCAIEKEAASACQKSISWQKVPETVSWKALAAIVFT
jgi:hypothetical protein